MIDLKAKAAHAALDLVSDHTIVGLGAGASIAHLANMLASKIAAGLNIQFVTASTATHQLLTQHRLQVLQPNDLSRIDIYFDGCDQIDRQLNALKSGGGIHTREKLLASMTDEFVIIGDESKLVDHFDQRFPVVLEVLPQAAGYVQQKVQQLVPISRFAYRSLGKRNSYVVTENGNYLLDTWLDAWPELATLNDMLKTITGVVDTSLFYKLVNRAIIASSSGVETLQRRG